MGRFSTSDLALKKNHVEKGTSTLLIHWALACGTVGYITKRNNTLREIQAGH